MAKIKKLFFAIYYFLNFLKLIKTIVTEMIKAKVSDIGLAARMPWMPMNFGKMMRSGMRKSPCRDKETKSPCFGLSVAEK